MKLAPIPPDEEARLAALHGYRILDTEPEVDFDEIARLATYVCDVPISLITLVDSDRQWFKACIGLDNAPGARETGFCPHAILQDDVFVVEDALLDERFHDNPAVTGPPHVRFYAGAPLITSGGHHIGTLCVIDRKPRKLTDEQIEALRRLGRQVIPLLEFRRAEAALRDTASISRATTAPKETADRWRFWPAILFLVGGLLLTAIAVRLAHNYAMRGEEQQFLSNVDEIDVAVSRRIHDNVDLMDGAAALWRRPNDPRQADWQKYFQQHSIGEGHPGLAGVGFNEVVPRTRYEAFQERLQADHGSWAVVHPEINGDVAYVVRMIEPIEIARSTIGYNMAAVPLRRATAESARDQGRALLTPPTSFDGKTLGFLIYRPVYRSGRTLGSVTARRAAHIGWVYALVRIPDLMDQLPLATGMRFSLSDSGKRLYQNDAAPGHLPFRSERTIAAQGRKWTVVIEGLPDTRVVQREMEIAFIAGALVTLFFSAVVVVLNSTRRRALQLAAEMTSGLRESESRVRSIVEHIADAVIAFPADGKLEAFNPTAERLFGVPPSSMVGLDVATILPSIRSAPTNGSTMQTIARRADGSEIPVELAVQPVPNDHRELTVAIVRDISERLADHELLLASEERYRTSQEQLGRMIENADDIIYSCDARGRFTFMNSTATRLTGYQTSELLGMSYLNLVRPDMRAAAREFYERQHGDRLPNTYLEFPLLTADGREIWLEQKVQPVIEHGQVVGYQGVARDVTERKRLESELALTRDAALESARLKSQFLATMSHEIRTPMNGVIGMSGLLLETELTPDQRELALTVQTSADSLLTIINDILDFSKIEAGKLSFERNEFDLTDVIDGSIELFASQARAKNIEVAALVENDVPRRVRGDAGRLRQVLTNLIGNAIKFTDAGEVLVTAAVERDRENTAAFRFTIRDTGVGIDADLLAHLFMPFVQADGSTTRRFGGTGLGLAICRQLVEMMNGEIGVESAPGNGSTFWFTVELEKHEPQPVLPTFDAPTRVLLVEGHAMHRRVLRHQLECAGVHPQIAESPEEALETLRRARDEGDDIQAGIVDLDLDAPEFAADARAEGFALPLILVTSYGRRREDLETYHAAGFARVLMKPVRHSHLLNCLVSLLGIPGAGILPQTDLPEMRPHTRRMRILVAEDNRVNQRVVLAQLAELGHTAVAVGNGFEALAALDDIEYDAVLMDCQMPEMDGYEATAVIRGRKQFQSLPIVAMTASAMSGDRERCLAAGMDDYLTKPFGLAQLADALARIESHGITHEASGEVPTSAAAFDPSILAGVGAMSPSTPDLVQELIALFRQEAPIRMDALRAAIAVRDPVATWRAAHAFKSGCANIGALRLAAICDAIEKHGRNGGVDHAEILFATLESELPELTAMLETEYQAGAGPSR